MTIAMGGRGRSHHGTYFSIFRFFHFVGEGQYLLGFDVEGIRLIERSFLLRATLIYEANCSVAKMIFETSISFPQK